MQKKITLFVSMFIVWMMLHWPPDIQHVFAGMIASSLVVIIMGGLFSPQGRKGFLCRRLLWSGYYIAVFLKELFKAGIVSVVNVLKSNPGDASRIIEVRTTLTSDVALALLAHSLTLSPAALAVDIDEARHTFYLHWTGVPQSEREMEKLVRRFETILKNIFE